MNDVHKPDKIRESEDINMVNWLLSSALSLTTKNLSTGSVQDFSYRQRTNTALSPDLDCTLVSNDGSWKKRLNHTINQQVKYWHFQGMSNQLCECNYAHTLDF